LTISAIGSQFWCDAPCGISYKQVAPRHGHRPRTTKLCDRTGDEITLDEVERITI
jgi:hypothetical protein